MDERTVTESIERGNIFIKMKTSLYKNLISIDKISFIIYNL